MTGSGPSSGSISNPSGLLAWNVTNAITIDNSTLNYVTYDVSGWSWTSWRVTYIANNSWYILVDTYDQYWPFTINRQDLEWSDANNSEIVSLRLSGLYGYGLTLSESHLVIPVSLLDSMYAAGQELTFILQNTKGTVTITLDFDHFFLLPHDALQIDGLYVSIKQDFSDRRTTMNLLAFIGGLFVFEPPGVPYPISTVISGIWYGCVAALSYVIFTVVRSLIPFLGGGD